MCKKFKILITSLILSISFSSSQAQNSDKAIGGIGIGFLAKLSSPKFILDTLEKDPEATTNYFEKNPLNYNSIANILVPKLRTSKTEEEYNNLYRIAELMGLEPIPPYVGKKSKPTIYTNPKQENKKSDNQIINPNMEGQAGGNIIYTPKGTPFDTLIKYPNEKPIYWDDYLILLSHSQELADNLDNWYRLTNPNWVRPDNVAAHHIVPATHKDAQQARLILIKYYGIDGFNNAINGVYLPDYRETNPQSIVHSGKHPDTYVKKINDIITIADQIGGKQQVEIELNKVRVLLKNSPPGTDWSKVL